MAKQRHIINKQIIEIHMPKQANTLAMQEKVSRLYHEKFVPIIDQQLNDRYGQDDQNHYQINQLTIDLGEVNIGDMVAAFTEKLTQAIVAYEAQQPSQTNTQAAETHHLPQTPLRVLAHYLMTGILPWWSEDKTRLYLHQQLDELLKAPDSTFKNLIGQLRFNRVYLDRFLNTFTEEQILQTLQLQVASSAESLKEAKDKLIDLVCKHDSVWSLGLTEFRIAKAFWTAVFDQVNTTNSTDLEVRAVGRALEALGAVDEEGKVSAELPAIQSLLSRLKTQHPDNIVWQQFFQHLAQVLRQPSIHQVDARLLKEMKLLLVSLEEAQGKVKIERADDKLKVVTETNLQPVAKHLHILKMIMKQAQPDTTPKVIEKLQSEFEDTDFISVQNAGLVIMWPFLQRFFENLDVIDNKTFYNETARNKAVCALQYLCGEEEEEVFEGMFTLNKVLCGVPLEDTVEPFTLSEEEKRMTEGLLHAVIARGPHWKNLTLEGFRSSYLQREGSLRSRDGHWLLQVKRETYDVTLEKLPWGFMVVKLPWMQAPLMVEWI